MNRLYRLLIKTVFLALITVVTANVHAGAGENDGGVPHHQRGFNPGVISPHAKIHGKTYGDWGAKWWNWALSVPYAQSPIVDTTGNFGDQNQQGPVWFLAGAFGVPVERTITIPHGKFIFFPLVNTENDYPCPVPTPPNPPFEPLPGQSLEDFLTLGAAAQIDPWAGPNHALSASVDGVELTHLLNYRGISKLTTLMANPDPDNLLKIDPCITGGKQKMVSDGFWIMLAPLKHGKHEIKFSAIFPGVPGDQNSTPPIPEIPPFNLNVDYHVTIER